MLNTKHDTSLRKFSFHHTQISPQELLNRMQLLCDFQDVYSQHQIDFGVVDIPLHITLKPHAELKKETHQKKIQYSTGMK